MAAMTVYNAFSLRTLPVRQSPATAAPTVPLQKPFASQRSLQSLAFNPAMDSAVLRGASQLAFVRPDVPSEREEAAHAGRSRSAEPSAEGNFRAKPQFRSALEQVSYVTNNKLWDASKQQKAQRRLGIFGL